MARHANHRIATAINNWCRSPIVLLVAAFFAGTISVRNVVPPTAALQPALSAERIPQDKWYAIDGKPKRENGYPGPMASDTDDLPPVPWGIVIAFAITALLAIVHEPPAWASYQVAGIMLCLTGMAVRIFGAWPK